MNISHLCFGYNNDVIFEDANALINKNDLVGIIGVNGAGKTTLFKLILNELKPDKGSIMIPKNTKIGYLPQIITENIDSDITVLDYLIESRPIKKYNNKITELYNEASIIKDEEKQQKILNKISFYQNELQYYDEYNAENILLKMIDGMKIDEKLLNMKMKDLSGGQKSKIAFLSLLYSKKEILLLDEPTNHLDKETKEFVVNYLKNYNGLILIISHDIDFLDIITNKTLYIDKTNHNINLYNGNYSYFKRVKKANEENIKNQIEIENREEKKLKSIIELYTNSSGKRKRMAQSREKQLDKLLKNKIKIESIPKKINLEVLKNRESSITPIKIENLVFDYDDDINDPLINNLSFSINKNEKFLIVGTNGVGKTTLLKLIMNKLKPISGEIFVDKKTDIGYYAQEHEIIDLEKTILDNFNDYNIPLNKLRNIFGRFLFYGDEIYKKVKNLSPGERCRVALMKLSVMGSNLLVLDEPTNHLDPETQNLIAESFKTFDGTMLIVSHNLDFVENLGINRVLILPDGIISYYNRDIVKYFYDINKNK